MESKVSILELFNILSVAYKDLFSINENIENLSGCIINEDLINGLTAVDVTGYKLIKGCVNKLVIEYHRYINNGEEYFNPNNYILESSVIIRKGRNRLSIIPLALTKHGDIQDVELSERSLNPGFIYKFENKKRIIEIFDKLDEMDDFLPLVISSYRNSDTIYSLDKDYSKNFSVMSDEISFGNAKVAYEVRISDANVQLIYHYTDEFGTKYEYKFKDTSIEDYNNVFELADKTYVDLNTIPLSVAAYVNARKDSGIKLSKKQ